MRVTLWVLCGFGLLSACVQIGSGTGGSGTNGGGAPLPVPLPPPSGGAACLDLSKTCSDAEQIAAYTQCVFTQCQAAYATCFGPSFANGSFAGDCKDYGLCVSACATCDETCLSACHEKHETATCTVCLAQQIRTCARVEVATGACTAPCTTLSDAGTVIDATSAAPDASTSQRACDSLILCCSALPPEDALNCQNALAATNDVDSACGNVLATYEASGKCS